MEERFYHNFGRNDPAASDRHVSACVVITFFDEDDGAEPPTTHRTPIVKDLQTDELIRIDTDQDIENEGHYLIYYLPKTKISVWEKI